MSRLQTFISRLKIGLLQVAIFLLKPLAYAVGSLVVVATVTLTFCVASVIALRWPLVAALAIYVAGVALGVF